MIGLCPHRLRGESRRDIPDEFLTTDDEAIRIMKTHSQDIAVRVDNPLHWLTGVNRNGK